MGGAVAMGGVITMGGVAAVGGVITMGGDRMREPELKKELGKPSKLLGELADSIHTVRHTVHSGVI